MEASFLEDDEGKLRLATAKDFLAQGNHTKALEMFEDMILDHSEDKNAWYLRLQQGKVFEQLADSVENPDVKFAYLLGSVECFSEDHGSSPSCARSLYRLAGQIGSRFYHKKSLEKAKQGLSVTHPDGSASVAELSLEEQILMNEKNSGLTDLIEVAESMIALGCPIQSGETKVWESKKSTDPLKNVKKELRSFWLGLDIKIKRDLLKVSIEELLSFTEGVHNRKGRQALEEILTSAREDRKWTFWMCRTLCSKKFSSAEECRNHLEQEHDADFKPSSEKDMVKRIGKNWARKISAGAWEPVDVVAAVEMIKNPLADVKTFKSNSGWSKQWPLAVDEERGKLLKEIKSLLMLIRDHKILSSSIRNWLISFPVRHLGKFEVSEQTLDDFHLVETPQSICFLECHDLIHIRDILENIKWERDDGTDLVCRAVDSFLDRTRVNEKIDFDPEFSVLLLDKRLLKSKCAPLDDEGTVNVFDPDNHYADSHAKGDDIISWLVDYSSVDKIFPRPTREHNLDIWLAVLRAVQFTCRTLGTKYAKKVQVLDYDAALTVIENLCKSEDEKRRNLQEEQWNRYASLLCDNCEQSVPGYSLGTESLLCAVRDVLKRASHPTYDSSDLEDCLNLIRERKSLSDDLVLESIMLLKLIVTYKVLLIDSKILLIDNSRVRLLNNLTRLSVFDNRTYMLRLLKPFLLSGVLVMESQAKSDAAEADLLLKEEKKSHSKKQKNKNSKNEIVNMELKAKSVAANADFLVKEEKKSQSAKKNKQNKNIKRPSTRIFSPLDKIVEHEPSVNLEPEGTSPSLKTVEEDFMEPEDILASEMGRLENSSNADNQGEATKVVDHDMQNMLGEDSLLEHLESAPGGAAAMYNSALDMTLKALLNIKVLKEDLKHNDQPYQDDLGEQVPCALQNFFSAFGSEEIKNEGIYSVLLSDLLASLKEVSFMVRGGDDKLLSMSSDAAEVLVEILEFWQCWKISERESLVTRLFSLEENETMSCKNCGRKSNYQEEISYGIVMAADSIRDQKCAFGNMKFVDILNMIRMQYQMLCDIKTGGCGETNIVDHIISRCPPIFTVVLEWEKSETEKEISETTKALDWEIDISRLYRGLEPNTNYRLVSMVGCGEEEEEHICLAYEKIRWVNLRRESFEGEDVGSWKNVVKFCEERKVRPMILFYEAAPSRWPNK